MKNTLIIYSFLCCMQLFAQSHNIIDGLVLDKSTNQPVPSATIRIVGSNKGTIAGRDGTFRLPKGNFTNKHSIKVTAVGYYSLTMDVDLRNDSIIIYLTQNPVVMKEALVIGDITVDEIIRRAIARKEQNRAKYNTIQCVIYSKMIMDMSKTAKDLGGSSNMSKFMSGFAYENLSNKYIDNSRKLNYTQIVKRRQTANVPRSSNTIILEEFENFTEDEILIVDTKFITPVHPNSLTHYKFELIERKMFDTSYVYVIRVMPNTTVYPTFSGTISIIEGTYQIIEIDLSPSKNTKIFAVDSLSYYQKFENISNNSDIWFPTSQEVQMSFKMKVIPFVPEIEITATAKSIVSGISVDTPLPDSIYSLSSSSSKIAVISGADEMDSTYWEDNSLTELSKKEKEMYKSVDTAAQKLKIDVNDSAYIQKITASMNKEFDYFIPFTGSYNRVSDWSYGLSPMFYYRSLSLHTTGEWVTGLHQLLGSAKLSFSNNSHPTDFITLSLSQMMPSQSNEFKYNISFGVFSRLATFSNIFKSPSIHTNSVLVWLFNEDYYDYYRKDGWDANLDLSYGKLQTSISYEEHRISGLDKTTDYCLIKRKDHFRENPQPISGNYSILKASLTFGDLQTTNDSLQYRIRANYSIGYDKSSDYIYNNFNQTKCIAEIQIPVFETGYGNMLLYLAAAGGITSKNTPVQYQIAIDENSILSNISTPSDITFITSYETYIGGNIFYSYHLRFNLRDWWWRMLHLPRIKGRGLELSLVAASGRFFNQSNSTLYKSSNGFYNEAGAKIGRIPIPGTDLFYWSIEGRAGIGSAKNNWGLQLDFQLPFSTLISVN